MKKVLQSLLSMPAMVILLILLAISIAMATFIEKDYGSIGAQIGVYNTWWFNVIFIYIAIILLYNIFKKKLLSRSKFPVFLFHIAFIIIIIGAGISRFFGENGNLYLRENESVNYFISNDTYITASINHKGNIHKRIWKILIAPYNAKTFSKQIKLSKGFLQLQSQDYTKGNWNKLDTLDLKISYNGQLKEILLEGKPRQIGKSKRIQLDENTSLILSFGSILRQLPFSIFLNRFEVEKYPGSKSPSSFNSYVTIEDKGKSMTRKINMSNILDYKAYRFFQSSYDQDEKGSILSVNKDKVGTRVTYIGYALMIIGMIWAWVNSFSNITNSTLKQSVKTILLLVCLSFISFNPNSVSANNTDSILQYKDLHIPVIPKLQADYFGGLWVQDYNGRQKPINTFSHEVIRKISKKNTLFNQSPDQIILGIICYPKKWEYIPLIKVKNKRIKQIIDLQEGDYASYNDFFDTIPLHYKLLSFVNMANKTNPAKRNQFEKDILKVNESLNIFNQISIASYLRIFPNPNGNTNKWLSISEPISGLKYNDSLFISSSFPFYIQLLVEKNYNQAEKVINGISIFQQKYGHITIEDKKRNQSEIYYNKVNLFHKLSTIYLIAGIILLIYVLSSFFFRKTPHRLALISFDCFFWFCLAIQLIGLGWRMNISGHFPLSNGYESLLIVSFFTMLAGLIFSKSSGLGTAGAAILAAICLRIAHLSWMDPEITPLVPVLKSYWLSLHVSIIVSSYGFLAFSALMGFFSMLITIFNRKERHNDYLNRLTRINNRSMTLGLYLLTIGTILGAIWANESWGRYWGWDPKESWALITIILYTIIGHLQYIPKYFTLWRFHFLSWLVFASVLMTYWGVNFYLRGLHSYGSGESFNLSFFVYLWLVITFIIGLFSFLSSSKQKT
ncbi:MAG: cytochrome c biogenesis protein CcsA [Bacteroidales bacterium]